MQIKEVMLAGDMKASAVAEWVAEDWDSSSSIALTM
jgi:hypothetical protein